MLPLDSCGGASSTSQHSRCQAFEPSPNRWCTQDSNTQTSGGRLAIRRLCNRSASRTACQESASSPRNGVTTAVETREELCCAVTNAEFRARGTTICIEWSRRRGSSTAAEDALCEFVSATTATHHGLIDRCSRCEYGPSRQ